MAIYGNGNNKIIIDIGDLNCIGEPYIIDLGNTRFILKYNHSGKKDDYGKMTLEKVVN